MAGLARRPLGRDNLFLKIWNRARLFFGSLNPLSHRCEGGREIQKTMNPNFLTLNSLISPVSPKNKFGKICKAKSSTIENKGNLSAPNRRILQRPRHPRILQGLSRRAAQGGQDGAISQRSCFFGDRALVGAQAPELSAVARRPSLTHSAAFFGFCFAR
ncbi:MAG: hypothetical protein ABSE69_17580, partial [Roseiarcus sp.]